MFKNKLDLVKVLNIAKAILGFLSALIVFIEKIQPYLHIVLNYLLNGVIKSGNMATQI